LAWRRRVFDASKTEEAPVRRSVAAAHHCSPIAMHSSSPSGGEISNFSSSGGDRQPSSRPAPATATPVTMTK
jgi:hypothetical protein